MWPFSKPKKPDLQAEARNAVNELRSEFLDDVLAKGMSLNDRVNRLQSVKLESFDELLGLVDDTADRVFPLFDAFPAASALEIHGFCASTVAAAVHVSELPDDEKPTVIDIYLDLWIDNTVQHAPGLDGNILKGSLDRMWRGFLPGIMRAAADEEAIKMGFPNPPLVLSQELDRLVGVQRSEDEQAIAAQTLKSAVVHAMMTVRIL
ncbi:hypothetical protein [Rhizobium ruizarguesonis]|uniref:hypothetical protein n=1 Tax=Rhizobium ruizarguesonis TaxID=2081791 RepID=UPI00103133BC|nr:hypothetical protein [Rhizobium ruizarguesonis]TAV14728.1 hypothetical protein ELI34_04260 [Rhizobium ruizarguesonis]